MLLARWGALRLMKREGRAAGAGDADRANDEASQPAA
jgi:hypothetical protein